MAVPFPQHDRPPWLDGGADAWELDVLADDYFATAPAFGGSFVRISGGARARVRMANGQAASVRLANGARL